MGEIPDGWCTYFTSPHPHCDETEIRNWIEWCIMCANHIIKTSMNSNQ
jgi:hypothetical protein